MQKLSVALKELHALRVIDIFIGREALGMCPQGPKNLESNWNRGPGMVQW